MQFAAFQEGGYKVVGISSRALNMRPVMAFGTGLPVEKHRCGLVQSLRWAWGKKSLGNGKMILQEVCR